MTNSPSPSPPPVCSRRPYPYASSLEVTPNIARPPSRNSTRGRALSRGTARSTQQQSTSTTHPGQTQSQYADNPPSYTSHDPNVVYTPHPRPAMRPIPPQQQAQNQRPVRNAGTCDRCLQMVETLHESEAGRQVCDGCIRACVCTAVAATAIYCIQHCPPG